MKSAKQVRKIAVLLRLSYASGRDLLYGISQYARTKCRWRLHVINLLGDSSADELRETVARGEVDGIIANGADAPAVASVLDASETPLVIIGAPIQNIDSERAAAFVHNDDVAIGRCGAAYLSSLGRFRSYGFASLDTGGFNRMPSLRERGFREGLSGIAGNVRTYRTAKGMARRSVADTAALGAWLKAMPKPAAVMGVASAAEGSASAVKGSAAASVSASKGSSKAASAMPKPASGKASSGAAPKRSSAEPGSPPKSASASAASTSG